MPASFLKTVTYAMAVTYPGFLGPNVVEITLSIPLVQKIRQATATCCARAKS